MSEPVTIKVTADEPQSPFPFDWELWVGDEHVMRSDNCFRHSTKALEDMLHKLRTLKAALEVGVRTEDGEPVDLDA